MNHSLSLSSRAKFALHLVHLMTNFELQLQKGTKFFSYFWLQLVRMKSSKKQDSSTWFWSAVISSNVHWFFRLEKLFFELKIVHLRLQRILSEDLYFFIGTVILLHLKNKKMCHIFGMWDILAKMSSFNLLFVWNFDTF